MNVLVALGGLLSLFATAFVEDWLVNDLANAHSLAQIAADRPTTLRQIAYLMSGAVYRSERDLGFDVARHEVITGNGGYLSCTISVISYHNEIGSVNIGCWVDSELQEIHLSKIRNALGPLFFESNRFFNFRFACQDVLTNIDNHIKSKLGYTSKVNVPYYLITPYKRLSDPHEDLYVGIKCSVDGREPMGRNEIESLLKAKRLDIIRMVLRSMNPEARVYGAIALLKSKNTGAALSTEDLSVIERVKSTSPPIRICNGCIVTFKDAKEIIREAM